MTVSSRPIERSAPKGQSTGPLAWIQKHLFNSPFNSVLTIVLVAVIGYAVFNLLTWAFTQANWAVVNDNLGQFMAGLYPAQFYWRLWSVLGMVMMLAGLSWGILARNHK